MRSHKIVLCLLAMFVGELSVLLILGPIVLLQVLIGVLVFGWLHILWFLVSLLLASRKLILANLWYLVCSPAELFLFWVPL